MNESRRNLQTPTDKQTPAPGKHRGRKLAIIGGTFVLVAIAATVWATSSDEKSDPDNPLGRIDMSVGPGDITPSPEKTFDGRYIEYVGGFTPNVQISLNCTNGKASSSASWLVSAKQRADSSYTLADVVDITTTSAKNGCGWQFSTAELDAWYKVVVPFEDTKKGYWKIHEQDRYPDSNLHQVTVGTNSQAVVLIYDSRQYPGKNVQQFSDISGKYNAPGEGAPDMLKLPGLPASDTSPAPSPTATP